MSPRPASVRWSEVTALFGGTFDPPHLGHRIAVQGLFSNPGVGKVLILPSPSPPHKPTIAKTEDRIQMAKMGFGTSRLYPFPGPVEMDLSELDRSRVQPGRPTYTFDTLQELRRNIPQVAFVIGTDQLAKLHTWHRFPDVLGLSHWIVLDRKPEGPTSTGVTADQVLAQWEASGLVRKGGASWRISPHLCRSVGGPDDGTVIQAVPTLAPAISSTQIRESLVRCGTPPEGVLLPEVQAYLMQQGIYGR